jgi:hypothetical protein
MHCFGRVKNTPWYENAIFLALVAVAFGAFFTYHSGWLFFSKGPTKEQQDEGLAMQRLGLGLQTNSLETHLLQLGCFSTPMNGPLPGEAVVSIGDVNIRKRHVLDITNPNKVGILNLELWIQFPEPILDIQPAETSASYICQRTQNWYRPFIWAEGRTDEKIEPYGTDQLTGLWKLSINNIPPETTVPMVLVTKRDGGIYFQTITNCLKWGELVCVLYGHYQILNSTGAERRYVFAPLSYAADRREVTISGLSGKPIDETNWVRILQGPGLRVPGVMKVEGYTYAALTKGELKAFMGLPQFETDRTNILFCLIGITSHGAEPLAPEIQLIYRK